MKIKMFALIPFFLLLTATVEAKKRTVKFRKHTEFNFSGDRVDGKLKEAGVFYIFQRKRSEQKQLNPYPKNITRYKKINKKIIEDKIKL
jgi:hypothetical protein